MADFTYQDKLFGLIRFNREQVISLTKDTETGSYTLVTEDYDNNTTDKIEIVDEIDDYADKKIELETTATDKIKVTLTVKSGSTTKTGTYTITVAVPSD